MDSPPLFSQNSLRNSSSTSVLFPAHDITRQQIPISTPPHPSYAPQRRTKVQGPLVDGFNAIYFTKFPQELESHLHILPRPRCPILMAPRPSYARQLQTKVLAHCMHAASSRDQLPICVYAASSRNQLPIDLRARSFRW